ncbi:apolipoprotein D [Misgurnus anguillicaudatus]|uniref:apolipoprotein D n=1 Tax=Misgurnus anguillicaudatus TaxID=75329 RepID=UPI003CCFA8E3
MKTLHVVSLTLLYVLAVNAQINGPLECPQPAVQQDFDPTRYMGRWYEIMKIPSRFQFGECCQATYALSNGIVLVRNDELLANGTISSIEGTAKITDPSEPAKLQVSFFKGAPPSPYWVLATDYDNYALVYSCTDGWDLRHDAYAWIMSRDRTLPKETISELLAILKAINLHSFLFKKTDQRPELCSNMP